MIDRRVLIYKSLRRIYSARRFGKELGIVIAIYVLLAFFLFFFIVVWIRSGPYRRLAKEGVVVEGKVIRLDTKVYPRSSSYLVTYEFFYEDEFRLKEEELVSRDFFSALQVGTKVSARCLPSDPTIVNLEGIKYA